MNASLNVYFGHTIMLGTNAMLWTDVQATLKMLRCGLPDMLTHMCMGCGTGA